MCKNLAGLAALSYFGYELGATKSQPTKRALDGWKSAAFSSIFPASTESWSKVESSPAASNANRWAASPKTSILKKDNIMQTSEALCPKCGGKTEIGFLIDTVFPGGGVMERQGENLLWAKGIRSKLPKPSWYWRLTSGIGFLFSSVQKKPVTTLRCVQCGYLELYAH